MKVDCQWMEANLEGFFIESLDVEARGLAQAHIESCAECREQVEQLRSVDPMIHRLFQQDLVLAGTPRRRRSLVPAMAFATAVAALLLVVVMRPAPPATNTQVAAQVAPTISTVPTPTPEAEAASPKAPGMAAGVDRAKPQPVETANQPDVKARAVDVPKANAPAFMVMDPAGYSRTLRDYHGNVLIFGLWSASVPETVTNLEKVYQALSSNTKLRILGVTADRQSPPADATFPVVRNQGSMLLGAAPSDIYVVDGSGKVRMKGSLLKDPNELLASIRTTLGQLGIH